VTGAESDVCDCLVFFQCDTDDGISSDSESPTSVHSLIRQMQEKERHILHLETEVARVSLLCCCFLSLHWCLLWIVETNEIPYDTIRYDIKR